MSAVAASKVIRDLLVTAGVGQVTAPTADWFISVSRELNIPDRMLSVYDTGGQTPDPHFLRDFPSVLVRIRTREEDYQVGYQKACDVKDALLGLMSQNIGADRWVSIRGIGDITFLARDSQSRPEWTANFTIIREPATSSLTHRISA